MKKKLTQVRKVNKHLTKIEQKIDKSTKSEHKVDNKLEQIEQKVKALQLWDADFGRWAFLTPPEHKK